MKDLPEEYLPIKKVQEEQYYMALSTLESYIYERNYNLELKHLRNKRN